MTSVVSISYAGFEDCQRDEECIVVQDRWCKSTLAINRKDIEAWKAQDLEIYKKFQAANQTCKPYLDIRSFKASCQNKHCRAIFDRHITK